MNVFTRSLKGIRRFIPVLLFSTLGCAQSVTQSYLDGFTPQLVAPGAPDSSYALNGLESVNLYNGNLNFSLPLFKVGGRGLARFDMNLKIEKRWWVNQVWNSQGSAYANEPLDGDWLGNVPLYGPGLMVARSTGFFGPNNSGQCFDATAPGRVWYDETQTRFTFRSADGTEYEFRSAATSGAPNPVPAGCSSNAQQYGPTFVTADGTAATFISDQPVIDSPFSNSGSVESYQQSYSGVILFRDGTRYIVNGSGMVTSIVGRNGNTITLQYTAVNLFFDPDLPRAGSNYGLSSATDSLGRTISVTYATASNHYDVISYNGYQGTPRTVQVWLKPLDMLLPDDMQPASAYQLTSYENLFPLLNANGFTANYDAYFPASVVLPTGDTYKFYYNAHGELARYILPTGGKIEFDYGPGNTPSASQTSASQNNGVNGEFGLSPLAIYRRVTARREYSDAAGATLTGTTQYSNSVVNDATDCPETILWGTGASQYVSNGSTVVTATHTDPALGLLSQEVHYFCGNPGDIEGIATASPLGYSGWRESREYRTDILDAAQKTWRSEHDLWAQLAPVAWWGTTEDSAYEDQNQAPANSTRLIQANTTLDDGEVSGKVFSYDSYNNQTDVAEYGFGQGSPGGLFRHTSTAFLTSGYDTVGTTAANTVHIRNLPAQTVVYSSSGTSSPAATTNYYYDGVTETSSGLVGPGGCPTTTVIGHDDTDYGTGKAMRGNLTRTRRAVDSAASSWIATSAQYDVAGNVVSAIDGNGNRTGYTYSDQFSGPGPASGSTCGFATSINFPPVAGATAGFNVGVTFDYSTGKPTAISDVNTIPTVYSYEQQTAGLDRLVKIRRSAGSAECTGTAETETNYAYPNANTVTIKQDLNSCGNGEIASSTTYDGLGRIASAMQTVPEGTVKTDRTYDALGRTHTVSNPYLAGSETPHYTTSLYDPLGRVVRATTDDTAYVATSYTGPKVTTTDQAGVSRALTNDAAGRLTTAAENPAGANLQTIYTYNSLDDLTAVTQNGAPGDVARSRSFTYDALKRLKSATNPESGTTSYLYDANGNLTSKTDGQLITTTLTYDALNRAIKKRYSDGATPAVILCYDGAATAVSFDGTVTVNCMGAPALAVAAHALGHLTWETNGNSTTSTTQFDPLGRVLGQTQITGVTPYPFTYTAISRAEC